MSSLEHTKPRPIIPALGNLWTALEPLSPVIVRVTTGLLLVRTVPRNCLVPLVAMALKVRLAGLKASALPRASCLPF